MPFDDSTTLGRILVKLSRNTVLTLEEVSAITACLRSAHFMQASKENLLGIAYTPIIHDFILTVHIAMLNTHHRFKESANISGESICFY